MNEERTYKLSEIAKLLNVHKDTAKKYKKKGRIPPPTFKGPDRWTKKQVHEIIKKETE